MAFADDFTFARAEAASWYDAGGALHSAATNVPRFSYADGVAIGLLIQPGAGPGQADMAKLRNGTVPVLAKSTVLHTWRQAGDASGGTGGYRAVQYDAHFTEDAAAMIDGCLALSGAHAALTVVSGYLRNWGGWVWAFGRRWYLPGTISAGSLGLLGTADGRPVIGV